MEILTSGKGQPGVPKRRALGAKAPFRAIPRKIAPVAGILGALLALGGLFLYLITPEKVLPVTALLASALLLLILFFIFHFEALRAFSTRRSTKFGANSVLMIALFTTILTIANFLLYRHHGRLDLSSAGAFSLSPQTEGLLKGLSRDIKITAFYSDRSPGRPQAQDLLESYRYRSAKISYEFVDPDRNPAVAKSHGITEYDSVVVEAIQKDGAKEDSPGGQAKDQKGVSSGGASVTLKNLSEQELTGALIRVTRETKKKIYFTEGHGERDPEESERFGFSHAKEALQRQGFEIKKILLLSEGKVPQDAALLAVAGPTRPFLLDEKKSLEEYLDRGGQMLLMLDPEEDGGLADLLSRRGAAPKRNMIIDPISRLFGGAFNVPIVQPGSYLPHEITEGFNLPTFYPLARSLEKVDAKGFRFTPIVQSSANSWGSPRGLREGENGVRFDPATDQRGPVVIAAALTADSASAESAAQSDQTSGPPPSKTRLVVFGDSDFATNSTFQSVGNGDLFQNAVSWLAREEELVSIRPREAKTTPLFLTPAQGKLLFYLPVVILPAAVFICGFSVFLRRRRL